MPHIAISRYGEIGKVYRYGIEQPSHACGSLALIVNELKTGHFNMIIDLDALAEV